VSRDKPHILIVDDSPEDRAAYRRLLAHNCEGAYEIAEAETAEEGLARCRQGVDCVLLDYRLPDQDGLEFLAGLAGERLLPGVAVIMFTGQGDELVAVQAMKSGAQDYLVKGRITAEALRRAVHNALEKSALLRLLEEQRRELERLATVDGLTGLYNRRHFLERLEQEAARVHRSGMSLSVLLLDLDHFKRVNDTYGHLVGDRVLAGVAHVLKASLRRTDFAARYGGEEFCVLAVDTPLEGAEALARRLVRRVAEEPFRGGARETFTVTCSIGVAQRTADDPGAEALLARADRALYAAKEAGRNCVRRAEPTSP
jgi:two-component system cell cycle response regulator